MSSGVDPNSKEATLPAPGRIMKPSDIPIYGDLQRSARIALCHKSSSCFIFYSRPVAPKALEEKPPGVLQDGFATIRQGLNEVMAPFRGLDDQARHVYETGKAHTSGKKITKIQSTCANVVFNC